MLLTEPLEKLAKAEIVAIGNEILIGKTLDTNTNWLAKSLTELGVFVKRAMIIRDNIDDIVEAIRLAMKSATLVITTGGLGPTGDDITLKAIGEALERRLELNNDALEIVKRRYDFLKKQGLIPSSDMTDARRKMAVLPESAIPLFNPVGAAPGVLIRKNSLILLILPGVPDEMRAIFETTISDVISEIGILQNVEMKEVVTRFTDESQLAPILGSIQKRVNGVLLKSLAKNFDSGEGLEVRIMAYGQTIEERIDKIEKVLRLMKTSHTF